MDKKELDRLVSLYRSTKVAMDKAAFSYQIRLYFRLKRIERRIEKARDEIKKRKRAGEIRI
jgi:hypothetical protein